MSGIIDMAGMDLDRPIDQVMLDDLEALSDGSLVLDRHHTPFYKDHGAFVALYGSDIDMAMLLPPGILIRLHSPITILWTPEELI